MSTPLKLLKTCSISRGEILVDGRVVFSGPANDFAAFTTAAFRHLQVDYPKFHKMDNLAKLGFLAAEHLLAGSPAAAAEQTGIVLANAHSSTDTDLRYNAQVQAGLASPALFVYTLPNIVVGEICIRHGFKGENTLFVSESYDAAAQVAYVSHLFANQLLTKCLGGWIDYLSPEYQAFFYLVAPHPAPDLPAYTPENVLLIVDCCNISRHAEPAEASRSHRGTIIITAAREMLRQAQHDVPILNNQLTTTNNQQLTTNNQQPTINN